MDKITVLGAALLLIILTTALVSAELASLDDTTIEYLPYREVTSGTPGVIYQIKIANTGKINRTYTITPDSAAVKEIGSYRIDPSDTLTIKAGGEQTAYFYLSTENQISGRKTIPVEIYSSNQKTTIDLVARPVNPVPADEYDGMFEPLMKIGFYALLVILIIILVIRLFSRVRRKKDEPKDNGDSSEKEEPEIETYY